MGANGTGKTTFLEVVAQRLAADDGTVETNGRLVQQDDFNYVPQDSDRLLFAHLTLKENIALQLSNLDIPPAMSKLFDSSDALSRYPAQCSGGQRQRAVICRAILDMSFFPFTLLDESFSSLSRDAKALLGPELKRVARESGAVVIFVSHDVVDAMCFGDRVLILGGGQMSVFDTSQIQSEEDCWREKIHREQILRRLRIAESNRT